MSKVMVIGDLHCPADDSRYLAFCKQIYKKHKCNSVIFIGDIIDLESISFHDKNPELPGPTEEFKETLQRVKRWYDAFPFAKVCIGNHDNRVLRKMQKLGIPGFYAKPLNEVYRVPNWKWDWSFEIDDVFYYHGDGGNSNLPAFNKAKSMLQSVVCGHHHSKAGVMWVKGPKVQYFGMNVGCGVNLNHLALSYARPHLTKAILACGVVLDGKPYLEIL